MKKQAFFLICGLLFVAPVAFAQDPYHDYKGLDKIKKKYSSQGDSSLRAFQEEMKIVTAQVEKLGVFTPAQLASFREVKIRIAFGWKKPNGSTRKSAFADPKGKTIWINPEEDFFGRSIRNLLIHEMYLAAGYFDLNYEFSSITMVLLKHQEKPFLSQDQEFRYKLYLAKLPKSKKLAQLLKESFQIDEANKVLHLEGEDEGSRTIVGGGGDLFASELKAKLLLKFSQEFSHRDLYLQKIMYSVVNGVKIERVPDERGERVQAVSTWNDKLKLQEILLKVPSGMNPDDAFKDIWRFLVYYGPQTRFGNKKEFTLPRNRWEAELFNKLHK